MDRFPGSVVAFARETAYTSRDGWRARGVSGDDRASVGYYRQSVGVKVTTRPENVRLSPVIWPRTSIKNSRLVTAFMDDKN